MKSLYFFVISLVIFLQKRADNQKCDEKTDDNGKHCCELHNYRGYCKEHVCNHCLKANEKSNDIQAAPAKREEDENFIKFILAVSLLKLNPT